MAEFKFLGTSDFFPFQRTFPKLANREVERQKIDENWKSIFGGL